MSEEAHDNPEAHGKSHKKHGAPHGGGHDEEHGGAPEWLISFADNVVLMMGFFVILLAMNMAKQTVGGGGAKGEHGQGKTTEEAMMDFAIAMREGFNNPVHPDSKDPRDADLVKRLRQRAGQSEARDPGIKGHQQDPQSIRPSEYYAINGSIPFAENSTEIPTVSQGTIAEVAAKVRGRRLVVEVRGHVSSMEASKGEERAAKLAFERALAVARALTTEKVAWWQLRMVTCADHDRLDAFPTSRNSDKSNARVEIILTDEVLPDQVPTMYDNSDAPNTALAPSSNESNHSTP